MLLDYPLKVTYFHVTQVKLEMTEHRHLFFKLIGGKRKVLVYLYCHICIYLSKSEIIYSFVWQSKRIHPSNSQHILPNGTNIPPFIFYIFKM